jgi:hypothetical protein
LCSKFIMHSSVPVRHIWTCFSCHLFWVWKWCALPLRQLFLNFWILPVNWSLIWSVFYYLWKVFWFSFKPPLESPGTILRLLLTSLAWYKFYNTDA